MDKYDAWDFDRKMEEMLFRFGIENLDQKVNTLSGGQKKRLALAMLLLDNPEHPFYDAVISGFDLDAVIGTNYVKK